MTKLFGVDYNTKRHSYIFDCVFLNSALNAISLKFDTGATHTVITLSTFIEFDSEDYRQRFLIAEQLRNSYYKKNKFYAAFGLSRICILCCAPKLILNGSEFENFYFYLAIPTKKEEELAKEHDDCVMDRPKALLGMDFISCCDFLGKLGSRDIDNKLLIRFNESRYKAKKQWQDRNSVLYVDSLDFSDLLSSNAKDKGLYEAKKKSSVDDLKNMGVFPD